MNETNLILEAQRGDLDSFNRLVLAYQDLLYNQAYRILFEPNLAEDATQEAFLLAYRKLTSYRGGSFRAWLLRIVTNVCYDELRRQKRRPTTSLEPVDEDGEEVESPRWMVDNGKTPEETYDNVQLGQAIKHCLGTLSSDFLTIIVLVDVQGLDYVDAAEVLGKPLGTIKSRLARARLRMRDCLKGFRELLPVDYRLERE